MVFKAALVLFLRVKLTFVLEFRRQWGLSLLPCGYIFWSKKQKYLFIVSQLQTKAVQQGHNNFRLSVLFVSRQLNQC